MSDKVTDSVYWCVSTITSTGYGDIRAYSNLEMGKFDFFTSMQRKCFVHCKGRCFVSGIPGWERTAAAPEIFYGGIEGQNAFLRGQKSKNLPKMDDFDHFFFWWGGAEPLMGAFAPHAPLMSSLRTKGVLIFKMVTECKGHSIAW